MIPDAVFPVEVPSHRSIAYALAKYLLILTVPPAFVCAISLISDDEIAGAQGVALTLQLTFTSHTHGWLFEKVLFTEPGFAAPLMISMAFLLRGWFGELKASRKLFVRFT